MPHLTRRAVLAQSAATALFAQTQPKPNILWLVSEDNNPLLRCYGDPLARTPNIDALAAKGVLYRHAYSVAPVCAPSRFAILTGVYPQSCAPANQMRAIAKLPPEVRPYPVYLREAGYYCTNNAKTDYNCDAVPAKIWDASGRDAHWKNRPAGKPFMAVFNTETTHESRLFQSTPGAVKPADVRIPPYLPDTPEMSDAFSSYYNLIEKMDGEIGARLRELDQAGLADDTVVFYYSDNGGALPRSKRYCYEQGLRTALVIYVPPKYAHLAPAAPGAKVNSPVTYIDLAPTLLSIAGIPTPRHMQGTALLGPAKGAPSRYAFGMRNRMDERIDFIRTVTDGRYRYIRNYFPHRPLGQHGAYEWQAKGYQSWETEFRAGRCNAAQSTFFSDQRPFEELYDLENDPGQIKNLAEAPAHSRQLRALRKTLDEQMLAINDNGFLPESSEAEGYLPSRDRSKYPLPRLMQLAAQAARRDAANLPAFIRTLEDANPVVRHWAILGIVMLGAKAAPAKAKLLSIMRGDPLPQNQAAAAEALARIEPNPDAVAHLASVVDSQLPWPIRLQAINALTFLGEQSKAALPAIRRAAAETQEYVSRAGRYLEAVLEGRYTPAYPVSSPPPPRV